MQSITVMTMFISTLKEYHYYVLTNILNQSLRAFFQIFVWVSVISNFRDHKQNDQQTEIKNKIDIHNADYLQWMRILYA